VRTLVKAGMAMAARRPMMTTTIMISTRVKALGGTLQFFIVGISLTLWI